MIGFDGKNPRQHIMEAKILADLGKYLKSNDSEIVYSSLDILLYIASGSTKDSNKLAANILPDVILLFSQERMTITVCVKYQHLL